MIRFVLTAAAVLSLTACETPNPTTRDLDRLGRDYQQSSQEGATPQNADEATRARAVSAGKATIGRAARFVGQEAVQLHGGMGMTEELAIGHYFKRLTAIQYEFGTTDSHIARYAELTKA